MLNAEKVSYKADVKTVNQKEWITFGPDDNVSCILGSCVSIVFFDASSKKGCISHCMNTEDIQNTTDEMLEYLKDAKSLISLNYGGNDTLGLDLKVGFTNADYARAYLDSLGYEIDHSFIKQDAGFTVYIEDCKVSIISHDRTIISEAIDLQDPSLIFKFMNKDFMNSQKQR